jgi:hypothetical protein
MTTFPGSPRLLKGALVRIDPANLNPIPTVIVFQYNPETLTRTLQPQVSGGERGDRAEVTRLKGPPLEAIKLEVVIDATDQMEQGDSRAAKLGIHPQLAALETLLYPSSARAITNVALLNMGTIEVIPPPAPYTLFVWGAKRILPVQVTDFSITEELHDAHLNPIQSRVSLSLRVLNYNDFSVRDPGYYLFVTHQRLKEAMAAAGASNLTDTGLNNFSFF